MFITDDAKPALAIATGGAHPGRCAKRAQDLAGKKDSLNQNIKETLLPCRVTWHTCSTSQIQGRGDSGYTFGLLVLLPKNNLSRQKPFSVFKMENIM